MKVCEACGDEISTKDGEGLCARCEAMEERGKDPKKAARARRARRSRDAAMRSLGLVKVRGALGGTYWE